MRSSILFSMGLVASAVVASGCGCGGAPSTSPPTPTRAPAPELDRPGERAPIQLCDVPAPTEGADPRVSKLPLFNAWPAGEVSDVSWAFAQVPDQSGGDYHTALVALGAHGGLIVHSLGIQAPEPLLAAVVEGSRLRVFHSDRDAGVARWTVLELSYPEQARELVPWTVIDGVDPNGWIIRSASDGERISLLVNAWDPQTGEAARATLLLDAETGSRIAVTEGEANVVFCQGSCGSIAVEEVGGAIFWRGAGDTQGNLSALGEEPSLIVTAIGAPNPVLLQFSAGGYRVWDHLPAGPQARPGLVPYASGENPCELFEPGCPSYRLPSGDIGIGEQLFSWDGELEEQPVARPDMDGVDPWFRVGDEVVFTRVEQASSMSHGPPNSRGMRRYSRTHRFESATAFRAKIGPGGEASSHALPFAARESNMSPWGLVLLRRGAAVSALFTGQGLFDEAELAPIYEACAEP